MDQNITKNEVSKTTKCPHESISYDESGVPLFCNDCGEIFEEPFDPSKAPDLDKFEI